MVLYVIGLGLGDEKDITVRGLEAVKKSSKVFLEAYTSELSVGADKLTEFYGKEVIVAERDCVESAADTIYEPAKNADVSFLVVGDPFCATTHTDLILRAKNYGVHVEIIHNASIMGGAGCCGLQLYSMGHTISIPFFTDTWRPDDFYQKVQFNKAGGLHTLCLLDIKVKEPDFEALLKNPKSKAFLPPRFMTVNQAVEQLLSVEAKFQQGVCGPDTLGVGMARVGQPSQKICYGKLRDLLNVDFGGPLHSLVLPGHTHEMEDEYLEQFRVGDVSDFTSASALPDASIQTEHPVLSRPSPSLGTNHKDTPIVLSEKRELRAPPTRTPVTTKVGADPNPPSPPAQILEEVWQGVQPVGSMFDGIDTDSDGD